MTANSPGRAKISATLGWLLIAVLPAAAQNEMVRPPADNPMRTISRTLKLSAEPAPPPDWVTRTRRPDQDTKFLPTGAAARREPAPAMSLEKLREVERSLDAERARHDRIGRRAGQGASARSVAIAPLPKKKAARRDCALTCASPLGNQRKR